MLSFRVIDSLEVFLMRNPYKELPIFENDINDFSMPYKLHGKIDRETMLAKYQALTNAPKNILFVRLKRWYGDDE
ncbi:hypothetical protein BC008_41490 [Mastigocoleus testarum BC008]|uniref:Uncharacterized protein n=2 Tax=Mastigocoleus TaxID=996924 RepID=A0A0V7ZHR9_9CYAN|nr:hypothetical protein BC008_40515 [Mastigocoleus testarum BC008]KST64790.1 hypothetical protein BC008_41490 [Mastigocoleus testarum BC008]